MVEAEWLAEAFGGCEPDAIVRGRVEVLGCGVDDWEPEVADGPGGPELALTVDERDLARPDVLGALGRLVAAADADSARAAALEGPFDVARRRARALGVCPVWLLGDLYTEHWNAEDLCDACGCAECVSVPVYELYGPDAWPPGPAVGDPGAEGEVPF